LIVSKEYVVDVVAEDDEMRLMDEEQSHIYALDIKNLTFSLPPTNIFGITSHR
jgi:hypothetical protein